MTGTCWDLMQTGWRQPISGGIFPFFSFSPCQLPWIRKWAPVKQPMSQCSNFEGRGWQTNSTAEEILLRGYDVQVPLWKNWKILDVSWNDMTWYDMVLLSICSKKNRLGFSLRSFLLCSSQGCWSCWVLVLPDTKLWQNLWQRLRTEERTQMPWKIWSSTGSVSWSGCPAVDRFRKKNISMAHGQRRSPVMLCRH